MDPKWLQSSMNKVNFDTENRLLKSSRFKSPCLISALSSLTCNTDNKILRELSGAGLLNKTSLFQRQISLCSDEPTPKKSRNEIKFETTDLFKDQLDSDDLTCNYDFEWPQLDETKEDEIESSVTDAKNKIKVEQQRAKEDLVNAVSVSLIQGVNLKDSTDTFRQEILEKCLTIMEFDPEFVLKMALYTRQELNIRTTANLLLAFASSQPKCRCYLKKYFKSSVVLPTDWLAVADQFQFMNDDKQKPGFLPAALRKVLVDKFSDFDQYQLAKYNKAKRNKKRNIYSNDVGRTMDGVKSNIQFSLKRMVGLLHIRDPAEYVMGLLGKRYPDSQECFVNSRLSGSWDESRAGKRMKLPMPDTWESWLSKKKNTAETWEFLIDGKMLPYMAMLRNLRNLLLAGISKKHHEIIVNRIKNKNAVIKSRQFPYRLYTALDIVQDLQNTMYNEGAPEAAKKVSPGQRKKNSRNFAIEKKKAILKQRTIKAKKHCSKELFGQYRSALQEAIEIAAFFNIPPIQGRTLIFLDVGDHMKEPALTVKSLGESMLVSKLAKVMTDMCCSVSERCDICEFHYEKDHFDDEELKLSIEVENLVKLTRDRQKVDTVLFVTNDEKELQLVTDWVQQHRATVNPQLLYVHLAIAGAKPKAVIDDHHPNDIRLVGYTDAILRFLSERNDGNRMNYIDNLDKKYKLKALPLPAFEPIIPFTSLAPHFRWQTVKVFISSTFLDMQSERDLLVRHIFPELRRRAKTLCMDVYEVDLRWGLKDTDDNSVAELCLEEVLKCQLFLGVLGERYGSVPDRSRLRLDTPSLECLQSCCPEGASITEMEFYLGALGNEQNNAGKAFFYLRDDQFHQHIPNRCRNLFQEEDGHRKKLLLELKNKVKSSGFEVFDGYPCRWGGVTSDGQPRLVELEQFGQRVLNNVWTALLALRQVGTNEEESGSEELRLQESLAWKHHESFIGCEKTVSLAMKTIGQMQQGLALLVGKRGSGKTALTAHLYNLVKKRWTSRCVVIPFITAASPSLYNLTKIINYFIEQFSCVTDVTEAQTKDIEKFRNAVAKVVEKCGKLILFLDGLDNLPKVEQQIDVADWLSADWPKGVVVVCSCSVNSLLHKRLRNSNSGLVQTISIGPIALKDRIKLIRSRLGEHSKRLDETLTNNQLGQLSLKRDSDLPLYLSLACEELRTFGDFEKLSDRVQLLKTTVEGLIEDSIISLEQEFGSSYVSLALSLLAVAPNGLSEEELYTLLGYVKLINTETINDITQVYHKLNIKMPLATYKRLFGAIRALTQASVTTLSLAAASSVMSVVRARYKNSLLTPKMEVQLHRIMVGHLWGECQSCGNWNGGNSKALLALPYHLTCGGCLKELKDVLCNLRYIEARFATGTGSQLLDDYRLADEVGFSLSRCSEKEKQMVEEFEKFVKHNWKILSAEPALIVQQAMNDVGIAKAATDQLLETQSRKVMRWENKDECRVKAKMSIETQTSCLCVALSPDGRYVAFGEGTIVQLYDLQTERKSMSLVGHSAVVTCLLFAGLNRLCSGSADGTVSIWNVEQGHRLFVLSKHRRRVSCLCLDSTGRFVISVGWDSAVLVWRLNDGELVSTIDWTKKWSAVNCVTSHPFKSMIVTGSWDGKLRIWCLQTLKRKSLLHGHSSSILAVSITSCGSFLASSSTDLTMKIWSCDYGFQLASIERSSPIISLNFNSGTNADKGFFIAGSGDGEVQIYSCNVGQLVGDVDSSSKVALTCLAINADSLVAGYEDGNVQLMKCGKGYKCEKRVMAHFAKATVTCVHWRPVNEGSFIILGMSDGQIHIADKDLVKMKTINGHRSAVKVLITSTKYLVSGDEDGVISIIIRPWTNGDCNQRVTTIHEGNVSSLSFRNDFKWIASTGFDQTLKLWNMSSLMTQLNHRVETVNPDVVVEGCHNGQINTSCWVENSSSAEKEYIVVTAGSDIKLCAWDASNGQQLWTKTEFNAPVNRLFSTRMMICGFSLDGTIYTWNCAGVTISQVPGHGETIAAVYFDLKEEKFDWYRMAMEEEEDAAPKTKTKQLQEVAEQLMHVNVARCSASGRVNIIKPCFNNKAEEIAVCHRQAVVSVSSGADNQIATSSEDGTVLVWFSSSLSGAKNVNYPSKHFSEISCLSLMKLNNNKVAVVSGDRNGYLMVWVAEDNAWKAVTRNRVHHKAVNGVAVVGSIKTTLYIVTCSDDQRLKFWSFGASSDKLANKISEPAAVHQSYKLAFKYTVESRHNAICLDYLPKSGCLSTGLTDDTLISYFVEFSSNLEQPFTASERDNTQVSLPTRNENYKPWIIKLKLISDDKMELIFAFTVNSLGELWLSTHQKPTLYEGCAVNFGTTTSLRDENTQFPESIVETYPMSMDICLVGFSTELATFHQFVGLANGFLLSLNLNFSFADKVATVVGHKTIKLHQGPLRALSFLRMDLQSLLVWTGGDDGVVRESHLNLASGTIAKRRQKFFCESSVTCLKIVEKNESEIFIGCGDKLGNVYVISLFH